MRYHEWILQQLRKEREMKTVTCTNCGKEHLLDTSFPKYLWNGTRQVTHYYCGQDCLWKDYIKRLTAELYE